MCALVAAMCAFALPTTAAAGAFDAVPTLDCQQRTENGRMTVNFGYFNPNPDTVYVQYGVDNMVLQDPNFRPGQPTEFLPGRHERMSTAEYSADSELIQYLQGTGARARASDTTIPPCTTFSGRAVPWAGTWDATRSYPVLDLVHHEGSAWLALVSSAGVTPGTNAGSWLQLAARGEQGPKGDTGLQGPKGDPGVQGANGDPVCRARPAMPGSSSRRARSLWTPADGCVTDPQVSPTSLVLIQYVGEGRRSIAASVVSTEARTFTVEGSPRATFRYVVHR